MFKRVRGEQIAPELPDVLEEASCAGGEKPDYSKPTEMTLRSENLSRLTESVLVRKASLEI
jgi:hypothetical protein